MRTVCSGAIRGESLGVVTCWGPVAALWSCRFRWLDVDNAGGTDSAAWPYSGKLKQLLRAVQLEVHLSKRQILQLHLERAPYGGTIQGVEAASWADPGKSAARSSHVRRRCWRYRRSAKPGRVRTVIRSWHGKHAIRCWHAWQCLGSGPLKR